MIIVSVLSNQDWDHICFAWFVPNEKTIPILKPLWSNKLMQRVVERFPLTLERIKLFPKYDWNVW